MKKLVRFMIACLMAVLTLTVNKPLNILAEEGNFVLTRAVNSLDTVYNYIVCDVASNKQVPRRKAPPKWRINQEPAFCSNAFFDTYEDTVYTQRMHLEEFLKLMEANPDRFLAVDQNKKLNVNGQLAAANAYYAINEVPEGKEDLYFSAGQLLVWKTFHGNGAVWPIKTKDGSTTDEQMKILTDAMNEIGQKAAQSLDLYAYDAYIYTTGHNLQKIMGNVSRSLKKNIRFEKFLILEKNIPCPGVHFNYEITPMQVHNTDKSNGWNVYAGVLPQNASVLTSETTFQSGVITEDVYCPVQLKTNERCEKANIEVDLSQAAFDKPGIYRYQVKEIVREMPGIVYDDDVLRTLDVYVVQSGNQFIISSYHLYKSDGTKSDGFVNRFDTCGLTLKKTVSGNLASRDRAFKFAVTFNHGMPNTQLSVTISGEDGTVRETLAPLSINENGEGTLNVLLKHGESVQIRGIGKNTGYTISENETELNDERYVPKISVEGDLIAEGKKIELAEGNNQLEDDGLTQDTVVVYENVKNGVVPTGVDMPILPAAFAAAGALGIMILMHKAKSSHE